jgi:uncharacterized protein YjbJ (UPF0337 family)
MRISGALVMGAIMGTAVMWLWGREMERYVAETAEKVLDRGGEALRRADDFLEDTKAHVSEALRAGQATMRPAPAAGEARSTR